MALVPLGFHNIKGDEEVEAMGKSSNCNPNVYRSKWDMVEDPDTDYRRGKNRRVIEDELQELEEMNKDEEQKFFFDEIPLETEEEQEKNDANTNGT